MAKGYINGIYSKTFLDGREFQSWLSDTGAQLAGEGRSGWAGVNAEGNSDYPNGSYVFLIRFEPQESVKNLKVTLKLGPAGILNASSSRPLAYKFLTSESSAYENAGTSTPRDGTFYFTSPSVEISAPDAQYAAGAVYLYVWNGASSIQNNYTSLDRGDIIGAYTNGYTLSFNKNGGSGGTDSVSVDTGEPLPDIDLPYKSYDIRFYSNDGGGKSTYQSCPSAFQGYFTSTSGGTQYYGADGKGLIPFPGSADTTLYAHWTPGSIQLPAATREGYSFAGWYTASSGGAYVGAAGDSYTPTGSTNLYARWTELSYRWQFHPVTARGNSADSVVRGIWSGFVGGREVLCAACNGYLWELEQREDGDWGKTACGAIDTSSDVHMFGFGGNMYLQNGSEYKVWDGSALSDVAGYRPMVAVSVPPAGGGTPLEQINKLCGLRRARFSPDGTQKVFVLPEGGLASIDYVRSTATGEELTGWTADTASGKLTFTTAPAEGVNSLEIGWTVPEDTAADIRAMRYAELYNGAQDSRIFVYGDGTNRAFHTGVDYDGTPRADYFPELGVVHVGDSNTPITAMIRHYDRLLAFKLDSAWSISYSAITLTDGSVTAGFYVTPVNRSIGCCAPGQAVLVENRPRTLDGRSIVEWRSASSSGNITGDERNAERISQRVDETIRSFDLATARTFYDKYAHEYYVIGADGTALVHGIEPDAWYVYTNLAATCLINYKDELYYGTSDGQLRHFSDEYFSDEGEPIDAYWESGSMPFDREFKRKYSAMLWVGIKPEDHGYLAVTAETDRSSDFAEHSFSTGDAAGVPEMNRIKLKAKKFTYYKLKLSNNTADTTATVVSVDLRVRGAGYVR